MNNICDTISIFIILAIAIFILARHFIKMRKNESATLCNGCEYKCSKKSFINQTNKNKVSTIKCYF